MEKKYDKRGTHFVDDFSKLERWSANVKRSLPYIHDRLPKVSGKDIGGAKELK